MGDAASTELPPYKQTCPVQSGFYGTLIQAHDGSHLFGAQPFHIAEHQGHPIFLGQFLDRLIEGLPQLLVLQRLFWAEPVHWDLEAKLSLGGGYEFIE